jgi:hypothetical protein
MGNAVNLPDVILSVFNAEGQYAEEPNGEGPYAECHYAEILYAVQMKILPWQHKGRTLNSYS